MSEAEYALGYHCGITFAGLKPASLFWIDAEQFDSLGCLRRCFAEKDFRFVTLRQKNGKRLLFVFHREYLARILFAKDNFAFLHSLGYTYSAAGQAVVQLRDRIRADKEFPHEVGLFLGYPLEDVVGFMRDSKGGVCLCGYWKVYGDAERKARIFERYKRCADCICCKLRQGKPLAEIFGVR